MNSSIISLSLAALLLGTLPSALLSQEKGEWIFSGPQKGERLAPFKVRGVYDADAGQELDFVTRAAGEPLFLIFVHKLTRPSAGLTRILTSYAVERHKDGLHTAIVWLDDDRSKAEAYLKRARSSLRLKVPVGISVDGAEGPGAYGLNRNVSLTILVAEENRVTANFALVQPSDTDAPRVLAQVVAVVGGKPPTAEELKKYGPRYGSPRAMQAVDPQLRRLFRRLAPRDLKPEDVRRIAREIETHVADKRPRERGLGQLALETSRRRDFETYGTAEARGKIRSWVDKYGRLVRQRGQRPAEPDPRLGGLLRRVIQRDATVEDVKRAVADVEKYVSGDAARERQLGKIVARVVGGRIFTEGGYGIPEARDTLRRWARKYAAPEAKVSGRWLSRFSPRDGREFEDELTLRLEEGQLRGTQIVRGEKKEIRDGRFEKGKVSFTIVGEVRGEEVRLKFEGELEGDVIRGKVRLSRGEQSRLRDWEARRVKETPKETPARRF